MSNELKQVVEQSLDLSTPTLREMVTRHAAVIDSRATLEDMPEALAFQIDMARALLREFTAIQQAEAQQPATGEPVAIGYINEMDELVKYPAPCIWMGQDCPRAKADRATHECYQRIYTHPAPSVPATGEPVGYMSEGHIHELAMGRIPYGYVYPEAGAGASTAVYTHPAPSVPDGYVLVPIEPTQAMMNVQTWDFSSFYSPREIWAAMLAAKDTK